MACFQFTILEFLHAIIPKTSKTRKPIKGSAPHIVFPCGLRKASGKTAIKLRSTPRPALARNLGVQPGFHLGIAGLGKEHVEPVAWNGLTMGGKRGRVLSNDHHAKAAEITAREPRIRGQAEWFSLTILQCVGLILYEDFKSSTSPGAIAKYQEYVQALCNVDYYYALAQSNFAYLYEKCNK